MCPEAATVALWLARGRSGDPAHTSAYLRLRSTAMLARLGGKSAAPFVRSFRNSHGAARCGPQHARTTRRTRSPMGRERPISDKQDARTSNLRRYSTQRIAGTLQRTDTNAGGPACGVSQLTSTATTHSEARSCDAYNSPGSTQLHVSKHSERHQSADLLLLVEG